MRKYQERCAASWPVKASWSRKLYEACFSRSQPVNSYEWFKNFVSADETRINYVVSTLHREVKSKLPV